MTADLSDWWITTRCQAGESKAPLLGSPPTLGLCRWCAHPWHGLPCEKHRCTCESTPSTRDDTWRPDVSQTRQGRMTDLMHRTGCDGFVAWAATDYVPPVGIRISSAAPRRVSPIRLVNYLTGKTLT